GHRVRVDVQAGQALADVRDRQEGGAERGADVALGGGVGEVPLQARGDQGGAQRVQQRAGDLEVRLRVLEADRVDLVRHRRGAGAALGGEALAEVAQRDVRPHVGGEVVQDPAGAGDVRVHLGLPVVGLDLRGQ